MKLKRALIIGGPPALLPVVVAVVNPPTMTWSVSLVIGGVLGDF